MKSLGLALFVAAGLVGCIDTESYGPTLTEPGKVVDLLYVPSGHGGGGGVGFTTGGNMTFTTVDVDIPARYGIVFECQHGRFAVENKAELWKKLKVGEEVTITYQEVVDTDPKTQIKRVTGLHFLDAIPKTE